MDTNGLEVIDITNRGNSLENIRDVEIKESQLPDIEVKEVVIKEAGNFLNLRENIINVPVEMIVFPFFTPQKQNKRVNFKYSFKDMGVTMYCTLVAKGTEDKVYQPSIFEEKIYTYLIAMCEINAESGDDEYIEFEISDFIVNFLGNKMNRNYYSKVEQGLKNLKNTEYQFIVSNHTKLGKYKFEDEEFKLLTYQKLKKGKKVYYRVKLNKNIRKKIQEKRYIKYNTKALLEIMGKDPIAARIYKFITMNRYDKEEETTNIRTIAGIIPLQTEQVTERVNKNGEKKFYTLSRMKQVVKRIKKSFDLLKKLKYVDKYKIVEAKSEDTYYIKYKFNKDRDGDCHVSTFIESKQTRKPKINWKDDVKEKESTNKKVVKSYNDEDIIDAEIVEKVTKIKNVKENKIKGRVKKKIKHVDTYEDLSERIVSKIKKAKRNIYASKAWNKRMDNKVRKLVKEEGEEFTVEILEGIYTNLKTNIKKTLVQYVNGIITNSRRREKALVKVKEEKKRNLTLFESGEKEEKVKINRGKVVTKKALKKPLSLSKVVDKTLNKRKNLSEEEDDVIKRFENLDDYTKLKVEEKAIILCAKSEKIEKDFILSIKKRSESIYFSTIKNHLKEVMKDIK